MEEVRNDAIAAHGPLSETAALVKKPEAGFLEQGATDSPQIWSNFLRRRCLAR